MNIKPKFVAKYDVWLELHDELIYVCDKDKNNSFVLGTLTKEGIALNRDVTKEQFETIALLYSTAERYFSSRGKNGQRNEIKKYIKPKYVAKYNLWLELRGKDIYICFVNKDNDFILGTLTEKGIVRNRSLREHRSIIIGLLYTIAENHFLPSTRDIVDRTTAKFININRYINKYLVFEWQAWLELENEEVYLYSLTGDKYQKIAKFTEINDPREIRTLSQQKVIDELLEITQEISEITGKHMRFFHENLEDFVRENDLMFFIRTIADICETTARRSFCPTHIKYQQASRKFRHNQKYQLIQDAINQNNSQ